MSSARFIDITCPQCKTTQKMQLWDSINVTVDPELKDRVLNQGINVFVCNKCAYSGAVDVSLLYHDMEKHFCVQYVAKEDMKSQEFYSNITKNGTVVIDPISAKALSKAGAGDYLASPHYVFSMKEIILYVTFRELCGEWGR